MRLNKLYWIKKEIEQIENEIKELTILSAVNYDSLKVSSSGTTSPVERYYDRLENLKRKLAAKLNELVVERERIEDYLESIKDADIRMIVRKRFIENKSYETIGREMFMDTATAFRKVKKIIEVAERDTEHENKT